MSLFNELKRRNVIRVATAYIVTAWLLIQVGETILPIFGYSDFALRLLVIVLVIGLLPVVVLTWAFEITPEGLNLSQVLEDSEGKSGDQVRITAQLIEARSDTQLWSGIRDRSMGGQQASDKAMQELACLARQTGSFQ
jgi:hypothetical protein